MSLNFYLPSISPIPYSGLLPNHGKLQFQNYTTFCLFSGSSGRPCRSRYSRKVSHLTFHRTPLHFFKDFIVTKAVKANDDEVSLFSEEEIAVDFDCTEEVDEGVPWEGAIVYRRNSSITHLEYCTTLERLGLGKISSEFSRSRASAMGLRITKDVKDYLDGTPVLISAGVTRKKQKLRLDGIIKTVISLACNRCGEPAAESVFSNFSLLLSEEPIEDPEVINIGTIYGEGGLRSTGTTAEYEDDEDASIDLDDRLYFPPEEKEIDISKQIRDMVHLEITINAVCDPNCKGLCLKCGTNLNTSVCNCNEEYVDDVGYGPLGKLRKQMQHK